MRHKSFRTSQQGITLVVGLIFLTVLMLLALAAMRGTLLEERMAGNSRDRDMAMQSAEYALRRAELVITGAVLPVFVAGTAHTPRIPAGAQQDYWINTHDWAAQSVLVTAPTPTGVHQPPRYVIERLGTSSAASGSGLGLTPLSETGTYRITARGVGQNPNTVVILQSIFER